MKKEKKEKNVTIRSQIQNYMLAVVGVALFAVGVISCVLNYTSTISNLEDSMVLIAEESGAHVQAKLEGLLGQVEMIGTIPELGGDELSIAEKKAVLDNYKKQYGWLTANIFDVNGLPWGTGTVSYADKEYFKTAISGVTCTNDPAYQEQLNA